jgi:predicted transposase YdaD
VKIGEKRGEKRGEKKGIEKGSIKEKIRTAKAMIEKGFDIDTIIDITGLDKKEIEKLLISCWNDSARDRRRRLKSVRRTPLFLEFGIWNL